MKHLRILLLALVVWGCATNPATGKRQVMLMSEAQEIALGRESDADVRKQMGVYNDANLQKGSSRATSFRRNPRRTAVPPNLAN